MKAVIQMLGSGVTDLVEVPAPVALAGSVVIASRRSLISAGTERMLVNFGRASILEKARQQPDKVRLVLDKVRTDGLITTFEAVRSKLDQPLALGYSNAGVVVEVGPDVTAFKPGDRVVSNGAHAELVRVPVNLCARIPADVDDEAACFAVIGAIGLQGVRMIEPTLGESIVVIGLGLVGLITVQILQANGCHVLGIDLDEDKLALARTFGIETHNPTKAGDPNDAVMQFTDGRGADAVIVAASTTSSEPIAQAARMCRKRGRVILVGVTGLELNRADFYEKELSFQVSCSYGPGRYDPAYEQGGQDYPLGFVRWTAQRNFEAVLSLMAAGRIATAPLISRRLEFHDAVSAYDLLTQSSSTIGIVLSYPNAPIEKLTKRRIAVAERPPTYAAGEPVLGWVGAGNYGSRMLIPAFRAAGARFDTIVTTGGAAGVHHGRAAGFVAASSDPADVLQNRAINTVVIATRHDTHAQFVIDALTTGHHVFVEKPLALTCDQVDRIEAAWRATAGGEIPRQLMVGFNRRFAPLVTTMKRLLASVTGPVAFIYTCNAGSVPPDHWTRSEAIGGGRIVGEACHFVDLLRHLAGAPIADTQVVFLGNSRDARPQDDSALISLRFANGSIGTIQYLANGSTRFPKERLEVFAGGAVLRLDNFRTLRGYGWPHFSRTMLWRQDKGQGAAAAAFLQAIRSGSAPPIPVDEIFEVARVMLEIAARQRPARAAPE
jgi:predicted dehydrogenase/threonine dehydrogenase-like Zn-dependent dehydrogenase